MKRKGGREPNIQNYVAALKIIQQMSEKEIPIKTSMINKDYHLANEFWPTLLKMKIVEPIIGERREGKIFKWLYRRADNELDAALAIKVTDEIAKAKKITQKKYTSEEWKLKKLKKRAEKHEAKIQIKAGADSIEIKPLEQKRTPYSKGTISEIPKDVSEYIVLAKSILEIDKMRHELKIAEDEMQQAQNKVDRINDELNRKTEFIENLKKGLSDLQ